jgi:hypothetical protein
MNLTIVHVQNFLKKIMQDVLLKNKANNVKNKANHVIEQKYQPSNTLDFKISKSHNASNAYEVSVKVQYIQYTQSPLIRTTAKLSTLGVLKNSSNLDAHWFLIPQV